MHPKETDVNTINLLKDKYGFGTVGEELRKISLKPFSHECTSAEDFITGRYDMYGDIDCTSLLNPEKVVNMLFEVQC